MQHGFIIGRLLLLMGS